MVMIGVDPHKGSLPAVAATPARGASPNYACGQAPNSSRSLVWLVDLKLDLDLASKLDRNPAFIGELMALGEERADAFLAERT